MITQRAVDIRPFIVMDVLEAAQAMERNGEDVIHLENSLENIREGMNRLESYLKEIR